MTQLARIGPPMQLRSDSTAKLFNKVQELFLMALPKCRLDPQLEADFRESFIKCSVTFGQLRVARNRIIHSAYIELKAGREIQALFRSDPRMVVDEESGEHLFDQEILSEKSFEEEFKLLGELTMFLGRCHTQLLHRYR